MFEMICILLFIGAPLFVLIAALLATQAGQLSLFAEKSPPIERFGSGQNYVCLEEQLRYNNVLLTDWLKHEVPIKESFRPSPQVLRKISLLKQYDPKKSVQGIPVLDRAAGGAI